jgi:hypothetical protein
MADIEETIVTNFKVLTQHLFEETEEDSDIH